MYFVRRGHVSHRNVALGLVGATSAEVVPVAEIILVLLSGSFAPCYETQTPGSL